MSTQAVELTRDQAQIRSNVSSFAALADQGAYTYLGRLFAPSVVVDYTSLWGGEPATMTSQALMNQWVGFLPGFDTTFHDLSNLKVDVEGDTALATVDVTASHWLGESFWSVTGGYEFTLSRSDHNWVITSLKMIYQDESGSRDVLGEAPKHAEENRNHREMGLVNLE